MSNQTDKKPTQMPRPPMSRHGGTPVRMKGEKLDFGVIKRLFSLVGAKYKLLMLLVILCIFISALTTIASANFTAELIDDYIVPMLTSGSEDFAPLAAKLLKMAGIFLLGIVSAFCQQRLMVIISQGILKQVRDRMFTHMQSLPIKYFDTNSHGDIMSRYTNDTDTLRQMISQSIPQFISSAVTIITTFIAMLVKSVPMTGVVVVCKIGRAHV